MITLTTPNAQKLYFKGTTVEISNVLLRLKFIAPADGKTIEVSFFPYATEADYNNGKSTVDIEGVEGFATWSKPYDLANDVEPVTYKAQTIQVAHDEVKAYLEGLGYNAVISGI
jgi:hypothetical protein